MSNTLKTFLGVMLLAAVAFFLGARYGRKTARIEPETKIIRDTVSCTIYDTVVFERPVYRVSYVTDTVATYFTTIEHDTVLVDVPIERKVYAEDSLYWASVSGWRCSLDTLILYPKETVITIHEKVKVPPKKLSFGLTIGPSALATPSGSVHAGLGATVGLTYRF